MKNIGQLSNQFPRLLLNVLFLWCLAININAQTITSPPEGLQARHFFWQFDRYVEVEEYGVHIFASETVSEWKLLGTHELIKNMIGALQFDDDKAAFEGVQIYIVTDADPPLTGTGLRGVAGASWAGFNESGVGKYSISEYWWNPNRKPTYAGWGISVHEFGHVMESVLGLRSRTVEVYTENNASSAIGERFAWGVQAWFNSPGSTSVEERRNEGMRDWQYDYYASIFDPSNLWTPDNSPRPTPYHRDSNPPSSKMLDDFDFNAMLGTYQYIPATTDQHTGTLKMEGTNAEGYPTLRWTNDAGQSWVYEPIYHQTYKWTLSPIESTFVNVPDTQTVYNCDPVERWDIELQNYRIDGCRFRNAYFQKIVSDNSALPFKDPKYVLFGDPFNRPDGEVVAPIWSWGALGSLSYTTKTNHSKAIIDIDSRSLRINGPAANSKFGGIAYLNHNFIDDAVFPSYRMNISVDINEYSTAGSNRQMSVSLGQSLAELEALDSSSPADSPADLLVAYRKTTDTLEIYKNGVLVAEESMVGGLPEPPTTMTIQLDLTSDFSEGQRVHYDVYFDDNKFASAFGFFNWSGTNENYIALSSNLSNDARFDNLQISTVRPFTLPQNIEESSDEADASALLDMDAEFDGSAAKVSIGEPSDKAQFELAHPHPHPHLEIQ